MTIAVDGAERPVLVVIPGAGGFYEATEDFVRACRDHGPTILVDYPDLAWHLANPDTDALARAMYGRIRDAVGGRPFVLTGNSLGGIVGALVVERGGDTLDMVQFVALDPAKRPSARLQRGWVRRTWRRARQVRRGGWAGFVDVRIKRLAARILAPRVQRGSRAAIALARSLGRRADGVFARQLRMRLMIQSAAEWRDRGATSRRSGAPCLILRTQETPPDMTFWQARFERIDTVIVEGTHDNWSSLNGPRLLLDAWDAASRPRSRA